MRHSLVLAIVLASLAACAASQPPPPHLVGQIAVLPVHNRTGDALVVSGDGLLDRYVFHAETITVADILQAEADLQLREKGFETAAPLSIHKTLKGRIPTDPASAADLAAEAGLGPLCLYLEVRRWEAEGRTHVRFVNVGLEVSLVDTKSRQVVWHSERWGPVSTPGQILLEAALAAAARKVTAELLAPLHPDSSTPR